MPLRLAVFARVREDARKEANTGRLSPCPRYGRKFLEMLVRHGEEEAGRGRRNIVRRAVRVERRAPGRRSSHCDGGAQFSGEATALARTEEAVTEIR